MFKFFMEACRTPLPELSDFEYVTGSAIKKCIGHECYFGTAIECNRHDMNANLGGCAAVML